MLINKNSNCATQFVFAIFFCTLFILVAPAHLRAQDADTTNAGRLETLIIKAFEKRQRLKDLPAAVNLIDRQGLNRFGTTSLVQAINTTPGIRMEERSPGSYRLNIRGSSLRSPFGVRNVKIYYNDLPITDPGGNTYFNSLGYYNIATMEIIKGPGSSVYGASTGGVMLINSMNTAEQPNVFAEVSAGSFETHNAYASVTAGTTQAKNKIGFQHQTSEGYREQSSLQRDVMSWTGSFQTSSSTALKTTVLYSHLFYETPGGLTKSEYNSNPKAARPAAAGFPSAVQSRASIFENSFLAGLSYTQNFSANFSNTTVAYGMFTEFKNPAIRNYAQSTEPHAGSRTIFRFQKRTGQTAASFVGGAEYQQSFSWASVYKNRNGQRDTLQTTDDVPVRQALLFLQASVERKGWELTAGGSVNSIRVKITRSYPYPSLPQQRNFTDQFSPRVSLAKKWKALTAYTSVANGFSPPTSAELFPSGSVVNLSLNAETGTNYDLGVRGNVGNLSFDVNAFLYRLQNTIVQRRDAGGGDYYTNAGSTKQRGVESLLAYSVLKKVSGFQDGRIYISHTFHRFNYKEFKQLSTDYSGKQLPGVAPHTVSTGLDLATKYGWLLNLNYYFSDKIPLNDANSEYAEAYHLLYAKIGFEKTIREHLRLKLTVAGENLLDEKYSLGNDINAAAGRYYNAAAGRNYSATLTVQFISHSPVH